MNEEFDVVVVGGGHNTLSAAAYLAKSGRKVCVLEKNGTIGGGAVTFEVTAPGFRSDTHASSIFLLLANPMIKDDELELVSRFGLRFKEAEAAFTSVDENGEWVACYKSVDKTCESIARFSEKDAATYRRFIADTNDAVAGLVEGMFVPPPAPDEPVDPDSIPPELQEILSIFEKSANEFLNETFEHPRIRMHFLRWMVEGNNSPLLPGTTPWLFMFGNILHNYGGVAIEGGTGELSRALGDCIKHHGGDIRTKTSVKRVITENGKAVGVELDDGKTIGAKQCVVGAIHPHMLGDMVDGLDPDMLEEAKNVPLSSFGGIHAHFALHEAPEYKAPGMPQSLVVLPVPNDMNKLLKMLDDCASGVLPSEYTALVNHHSVIDPSRTPDGKHLLAIYVHAPLQLKGTGPLNLGDADGWTSEIRDLYKKWILEGYAEFCTNMGPENVIASAIQSPRDMAAWSPSFKFGDIFGVTSLTPMGRPTPRLSQYAVPGAEGLYITGPFCHPGGSINGGGRAAAVKILSDLEADTSSLFLG